MTAHAALDASATRMEAGFAGVAEQLSALRGGLTDLVARLADLDRVLSGQKAMDRVMDIVAEAAKDMRQALDTACAAATPSRVQSAQHSGLGAVAAMETQTRMLNAVASLSLITARSLGFGGLEDYVRDLRRLSAALSRDAASVGEAVASLRRRRARARDLFVQADAALSEVMTALADHAGTRADKERMLAATISGVGSVTARLPAQLAAEMESLIRAMQFADAAAQRIDHIRRILARGGVPESALAAAQIDALVAATRATLAEARTSLVRIGAMAAESGRILAADRDAPESRAVGVVELNRALLAALARAATSALQATDGAAGESVALQELAQDGARRFASLSEATRAIHVAAVNAALLSRAANGQEKAINVLAVDVQQQAAVCTRVAAACQAAIAELTRAEDLAVFGAVSGKAQVFRRAIAETDAAISAGGAALAELDRLQRVAGESLRALGPALQCADEALGRIAASADDLGGLARALPRTVPAGSDPLADLFDLYTMEAERAVHRRLFGLPEDPASPAGPDRSVAPQAGADADLVASILF